LNTQENKCKVLEIILHDLKGNHCEIIAFVSLCRFSSVVIGNVTIGVNEELLYIIEGVQMSDANANEELGSDKNKGEENEYALIVSEIPTTN
jgi:hypothetical protein